MDSWTALYTFQKTQPGFTIVVIKPSRHTKHPGMNSVMDQQGSNKHSDEMEEILQRLRVAPEKHGKDKECLRHKLEEAPHEEYGDQQDEAPADTVGDADWSPTNAKEWLRKYGTSKAVALHAISCRHPARQRRVSVERQQSISGKL
ncbi:hypothetical protein NDU88_002093 [Pleurodeles waltl]|uniref:Uncharacterized protein n=1 Tax=Pleurodeles waltl TaxID=8319 RepID=A0AAV7NH09_PLEWA|nr:hypothetical protein NDU88_002093 [Pleurodeles waltl]